jgi:hypothetical protein
MGQKVHFKVYSANGDLLGNITTIMLSWFNNSCSITKKEVKDILFLKYLYIFLQPTVLIRLHKTQS